MLGTTTQAFKGQALFVEPWTVSFLANFYFPMGCIFAEEAFHGGII